MGLLIRDDTVRDLAKRLAEARRTTVTEAVRQAIEHELAALQRDRVERERVIRESLARIDAMPNYDFDENDMYDEFGAPR
jgi:hypothetical protein